MQPDFFSALKNVCIRICSKQQNFVTVSIILSFLFSGKGEFYILKKTIMQINLLKSSNCADMNFITQFIIQSNFHKTISIVNIHD